MVDKKKELNDSERKIKKYKVENNLLTD